MSSLRDPIAVAGTKIAWTEGTVSGFVPWSIFVKDESANREEEAILFYQSFGFDGPAWRSIDEHPFLEATPADVYDAVNHSGRWGYLRYRENIPQESFQHRDSRVDWLEERRPKVSLETVKEMLVAAGLEFHVPEAEERFHLVPDWESVISYEKYHEEIEANWEQMQRDAIAKRAKKECPACASDQPLYGDGYRYFHRKDFAFVKCASSGDHEFLETKALEVYSAKSKSHYHLLRGDIDSYSRTRSSRRRIRSHSAFQKILAMGEEAIPFILNDLRKGRVGGIWTAEVLAELVGQRGGDAEWWIQWAKAQKYAELES
jgi:hypothetical protein